MKFHYRIYCFRDSGAIIIIYTMFKQILIAIVLMTLLIGNSWDAEASGQSSRTENNVDFQNSEAKVREKRFINPFSTIVNIWNAVTHMYSLYSEVSLCFNWSAPYKFELFNYCWHFSKKTKQKVQLNKHMIFLLTGLMIRTQLLSDPRWVHFHYLQLEREKNKTSSLNVMLSNAWPTKIS